jgi:glycosyltransferase involved in cell wall biosynthesis
MLAATAGVKARIAHSHNDTANIDLHGSLARASYLKITKALVRRTSTLGIAASKMAGNCLFPSGWESSPKWQLAPYGVDFTPFDISVDRAEVRRQLGIPSGSIVVGHVGRFCPQKNHALFVKVAARFAELEPHAFFLMVGDGPLRAEVESDVKARRLVPNFLFTGVRSDIPRLMKGAMDLFLFPSLHEGLGIVVLEAQLACLPCLLSEAIPPEADIFPELVRRLSLAALPTEWAHGLFQLSKKVGSIPHEKYMRDRAMHSIESSVDLLANDYGPALKESLQVQAD